MILKILYYLLFSGLFYLIYRGLYARMSFHRVNRFTLLLIPPVAASIALVAPEFSLPWQSQVALEITLPEVVIEGERLNNMAKTSRVPTYWTYIYLSGILLSILYFFSGILLLARIIRKSESTLHEGNKIYYSDLVKSAFCFGPYVIVPAKLKGSSELKLMIEHELLHQKLGHSIDRLYYKVISTILWFDPFVHFFSKELRQVHEYEVDAHIIQDQKIENYAHMLLSSTLGADLAYPEKALSPSPFFNSSLIKSRITMLYRNPSPAWRKSFYLSALPIIAAMTLFACNKSEEAVVEGRELKTEAVSDLNTLDQLPVAPGCDAQAEKESIKSCAFQHISSHIAKNFKYPELAKEIGLQGRIMIAFVIDEGGAVNEVEIVQSMIEGQEGVNGEPIADQGIDQEKIDQAVDQAESEALKLVGSIPSFESGALKDGHPVALRMVIPIQLKLN